MEMTNATPALFAALAAAQGEVGNATKRSDNPHFRSKYADLAEVLNTTRETLPHHGLSLTQSTAFDGSFVHVTTVVAHAEGGWISSTASCIPAKSDAQGIGASTTYLRRYGAAAMAGIAQEDDDGNAAQHDRRPMDPGKMAELTAAISASGALEQLQEVGRALASANLPASSLTDLRAAFSRRQKELTDGS